MRLPRNPPLRQRVAEVDVCHTQVRILGSAGGDDPRRAAEVRELSDERERSIIRISPESWDETDGGLLNASVVAIRRTREAIAAWRFASSATSCKRVVPSDVDVAVIAVDHKLWGGLVFNAHDPGV